MKTENNLNEKQEKFCQTYVSRDFFGNGTQAYLEVYGFKDEDGKSSISYDSAKANAYRLLTNDYIVKRINDLLESGGFNAENVDKQHLFLINQHADLKTKMAAIKEYNALKKRTENPNTPNVNIIFSDEQLRKIARETINGDTPVKG